MGRLLRDMDDVFLYEVAQKAVEEHQTTKRETVSNSYSSTLECELNRLSQIKKPWACEKKRLKPDTCVY
jgi:hypothetical protein